MIIKSITGGVNMRGFTYNGVHSGQFGCYFIPSAIDQGRDMPAYTVDDMEREGGDGGFYIGNKVPPQGFFAGLLCGGNYGGTAGRADAMA